MDFEHGIEKGNGKTVNREQEHMPPEHLDEDIAATTIATRWNNAKAAACQSQQTHTHTRSHTHMGHDEVFSALFLYRRKGRVRWESRRECFTMTKWKLHVRTSPPWGNAICSGWGLLRHRQPSEWRGEERSGASCCSKLKTDQRKMPQRGNMRALPARRDSQNYYRKNGQKGQLWTAGTSG